ncbi:MAG: helix-turn-helix transcriptional regulator [Planctomycetota bacterium]
MHDPSASGPSAAEEAPRSLFVAIVFALVATFAATDLLADLREGTTWRHTAIEGGIILCALAGLASFVGRYASLRRREREARSELRALGLHLETTRQEAERWRAEARDALDGLSLAIDRQLARWGLTPAEKEIALLLLKGLSHKEIAVARHVSETTVRQQSRGIYKKAGIEGRHELAAFFLEDLLQPPSAG